MTQLLSWAKPESYSIAELQQMAAKGLIRIPEFQRSFRWEPSDVRALFDSLLRGYPVGNLLLWRSKAPAGRVHLGNLLVDAEEQDTALWVIDGQQRITSLVNAVSPESQRRSQHFTLVYSLDDGAIKRPHDARGQLAIPLPDLFDMPLAVQWAAQNEANEHIGKIAAVNQFLRDIRIPASVVAEEAGIETLREIFDRMNSTGKRLRGAEIFDALHRSLGERGEDTRSTRAIAQRLSAATNFGTVAPEVVLQAILVRRHPDFARDPHGEFTGERRKITNFPKEEADAAYEQGEFALSQAISFLSETAGVPHITFLPYRTPLLVLARFFAFHPDPNAKNRALLTRWFWRASVALASGTLSNAPQTGSSLAGKVDPVNESGSIQALLSAVEHTRDSQLPDDKDFSANTGLSKIQLCAYWDLKPVDPTHRAAVTPAQLAEAIEDEPTATPTLSRLFPRRRRREPAQTGLAARLLLPGGDGFESLKALTALAKETSTTAPLTSHLLEAEEIEELDEHKNTNVDAFINRRADRFTSHIQRFLAQRTAWNYESTPPLEHLDFDVEDEAA